MTTPSLLQLSASRLAKLIRSRQLSSRDAVEAHIAAIEKYNPVLNAVVAPRFDHARREARAADEQLERIGPERVGVFHGVPCTVKESFGCAGMPNTGGLPARHGSLCANDAITVTRLRATGAIPLGVTNVSELCMWLESYNTVYGRTCNPYDSSRIAGGSSGGEGAIIGAGASPLGLGSDIGGSIRLPAFFCGVFGHKPTGGAVPNSGQFPTAHNEALRYMTTGPLARRAEDLFPTLLALAGPDAGDPQSRAIEFGRPENVDVSQLQVVSVADNGLIPVSGSLRAAQRRCAKHLATVGAKISAARPKALRRSIPIWGAMLASAGGPTFSEMLGSGQAINPAVEFGRWALGRSPHTFPALALATLERIPTFQPENGTQYVRAGHELRRELEQLIGPNGVMLYPSYSRVAPSHNTPLLRPFDFVYTAIINVMELPATQVPLGLDDRGLPLGVQVIAARGNDHLTIAVALELERAFGGWVPPVALPW